MGIVFFCQSCGARFEIDPRLAGKKGRCKQCGQMMSVPRAEHLASMAAMPALAAAGVEAAGVPAGGARAGAHAGRPPAGSGLQGGEDNIKLAPVTVERMAGIFRKKEAVPSALAEDSKPYQLVKPDRREARLHGTGRPAGIITRLWRGQLGSLQKLFRRINETAYLFSVPFIMIFLLGTVVRNRPMAIFGATIVVLLNIGRLVSGGANLAVIPFRDGFDFNKMKKPFRRIIEPLITVGLVVAAFVYVPWLSGGQPAKGSVTERFRATAESLGGEMRGQVDTMIDKAKQVDLEKYGSQLQGKFKDITDKAKEIDLQKLGTQVREKFQGNGTQKSDSSTRKERGGGLRSAIDALQKRTEEELDKAKALNESSKKP
jgi:hypothetical protein